MMALYYILGKHMPDIKPQPIESSRAHIWLNTEKIELKMYRIFFCRILSCSVICFYLGNIWYSSRILRDIEHFVHGQSSSGKPHVLPKRKDFMHNKISKKLKYCQIYFMSDRIVIITVMSCQLLSWRKQFHEKILRGKDAMFVRTTDISGCKIRSRRLWTDFYQITWNEYLPILDKDDE